MFCKLLLYYSGFEASYLSKKKEEGLSILNLAILGKCKFCLNSDNDLVNLLMWLEEKRKGESDICIGCVQQHSKVLSLIRD